MILRHCLPLVYCYCGLMCVLCSVIVTCAVYIVLCYYAVCLYKCVVLQFNARFFPLITVCHDSSLCLIISGLHENLENLLGHFHACEISTLYFIHLIVLT